MQENTAELPLEALAQAKLPVFLQNLRRHLSQASEHRKAREKRSRFAAVKMLTHDTKRVWRILLLAGWRPEVAGARDADTLHFAPSATEEEMSCAISHW